MSPGLHELGLGPIQKMLGLNEISMVPSDAQPCFISAGRSQFLLFLRSDRFEEEGISESEMASGWGISGNKGRCFDFWNDFSECMSRCREPKECAFLREDYFECLHHAKEVIPQIQPLSRYNFLIHLSLPKSFT